MNIYERARAAAITLAQTKRARKDEALRAMADALVSNVDALLDANALDIEAARRDGTPESTVDRLALSPARISGMAAGCAIAACPTPWGRWCAAAPWRTGSSCDRCACRSGSSG